MTYGFGDELADAILDGTPIEWSRIESARDPDDQELLLQLKTLAAVKQLSREATAELSAAGFSWGQLQVFEPIGRGAFGEVFRAWDPRLDREVALKLLPDPDPAGLSPTAVIEEGRLLARIRHPNVVTIHGAERRSGLIGLWMEFIKGRTLEELLREGKVFDAGEVIRIGIDLCRAVSAVHAAGLLHRDLKAQNVMVADDGRLVLMDFGTGRELEALSASPAAGTPLYLAPEVLSGGHATERSEVYSIGVLLHHILTGSYPVAATDLAELRRAHEARLRTALSASRPDLPPRLARIVEKACDPEPDRRHASADTLGDALAALEGMPRSVRRAYAAAAALALVAVATIGWQLAVGEQAGTDSTMASAAGGARAGAHRPVVAVLPFTSLDSDAGAEDFVDGLTSEVVRTLASIGGVHVRSSSSSFAFKGKTRDLLVAGIGADLVVEAGVRRVGHKLLVSAQLVRASDAVVLWSQSFDGSLADLFTMQDQIARGVASHLGLRSGQRLRRYAIDGETSEMYMRARALVDRAGHDNAARAAALFEQVVARQPDFAPGHAGAADAYAGMSWQLEAADRVPLPQDEALRRMREAASAALALDGQLADAHGAMGTTYARARQWVAARTSFDRAIQLDPTQTNIHTQYVVTVLLPMGKIDEALRLLEAALDVDPMSLDVRRTLGFTQIVAGRYDEAIVHLRSVLSVDPDYPHTSLALARALTFSGRLDEAEALWKTRQRPVWAAHTDVRTGKRADVEGLLATVDHPYRRAIVFAALGDRDRTFEALDRAVDVLPQRAALLLVLPEMAFIQGDPRLALLRKKLKLP